MKLVELWANYPEFHLGQYGDQLEVLALDFDSRQVSKGSLFVALSGGQVDGHDYLEEVIERGAVGLVVERMESVPKSFSGPVLCVPSSRQALGHLAGRFYGHPDRELFCVAVTGTNGKTSVTYMVEHILNKCGWPTGVLGTIDHHLGEKVWASQLTTPDPVTLQSRLRELVDLDARACAFEVSSHALSQSRVEGLSFDVAVFTNLSRDHLDYHGSMENYFLEKQKLFSEVLATSQKGSLFAIINGDDSYAQRLMPAPRARVWTYGQEKADFEFKLREVTFSGCRFDLRTPQGEIQVQIPVPGLHSVYNATAALAVAGSAGFSVQRAAEALQNFLGVPGRLQRVPLPDREPGASGVHVFVDYAHTHEALGSVLSSLRQISHQSQHSGRIITIFGCGGDRDKGKRPLMTAAALRYSDQVWVTSDNPRSEDPLAIIQDAVAQLKPGEIGHKVFVESDRRQAIYKVLEQMKTGDVILIAGKGHEDYQMIGHEKHPFSDAQVVREFYGEVN